jgi:hypothetical protein
MQQFSNLVTVQQLVLETEKKNTHTKLKANFGSVLAQLVIPHEVLQFLPN